MISYIDKGRNNGDLQVTVNFIGDNSHAILPLDKIMKYQEGYAQFSKTKKRSLREAIEIANRIEAGITTYTGTEWSKLNR